MLRVIPNVIVLAGGAIAAGAAAATTFNPRSWIYRNGGQLEVDGLVFTATGADIPWLGLEYTGGSAKYPARSKVTETLDSLAASGINVIRSQTLGVSVGDSLSVMPALGQINEDAFEAMDWAIYQASLKGIRITAPLTDSRNTSSSGLTTFLRWKGHKVAKSDTNVQPDLSSFYTDTSIIKDLKNYIKVILNHTNRFSGITYAEDPTIFAYEIGSNERMNNPNGHNRIPDAWVNEIAGHIKQIAPKKLVINASPGPFHLYIPKVDLFYYPEETLQSQTESRAPCLTTEYSWSTSLRQEQAQSMDQVAFTQRASNWRCYFDHTPASTSTK